MSAPKNSDGSTNGKRRLALISLSVLVLVIAIPYLLYWYLNGRFHVSTDDAYVAGNRVVVTARVPGTVTQIAVDATDRVQAGEPLVLLNETDAHIALSEAEANLAQRVRQTQELFHQVGAQDARFAAAQAGALQAQRDWRRAQRLFHGGAISRAKLEQADTLWLEASAQARLAKAELAQTRALIRGAHVESYPAVLAAEATVRRAYATLARGVIRAPVSGYVAKRSVELGQQVAPGQPLMIIVPLRQVWVNANFKERDIRSISIGQPVTLTADWYGSGVVFHGRVTGIEPGSGSAFSLLPPENASGNWIKIVQRVPIRIALDPRELRSHPLRLGLSMNVVVSTRHHGGRLSPARKTPRYQTSIYGGAIQGANAAVDQILRSNIKPLGAPPRRP